MVQNIPNQMTFDQLKKLAEELGAEKGRGNDNRIKFQLKVLEGAFYGSIDLDEDKHGKGRDDASVLTETYTKAQSGASYFDRTAPNVRKETSCTRAAIKLGQWPHGGPGEPLLTSNNLVTEWTKLRQKPENKGKLDDMSNVFMKFCRTQVKRDSLMDKAELYDLCFKKESAERTLEQRLESVRKELTRLKDLDGGNSHLVAAAKEVTKRLEAIAQEKKKTAQAQKTARQAHTKAQSTGATAPA